eukprot:CAMPEP_0168315574 /NCGR_PEP_ID=MMETSP0210-20121227/11765_1 /TAXON_ID=40633 /ORGANISM="Condylostoma magnum, Strain COL2" /LENGTH=93 /DNA_ID=CAMNT_0008289643 /DNA_START=846 /DNA_END=1127 /DNA_ORIENTATION=+
MGPMIYLKVSSKVTPVTKGIALSSIIREGVALNPYIPLKELGIFIEPATSVPRPKGANPAATIPPSPEELAPVVLVTSQGFKATPTIPFVPSI